MQRLCRSLFFSALRYLRVEALDLLHNFMRRLQRRKIGMVLYTCDINRRVKYSTAPPLLASRYMGVQPLHLEN